MFCSLIRRPRQRVAATLVVSGGREGFFEGAHLAPREDLVLAAYAGLGELQQHALRLVTGAKVARCRLEVQCC